MVNWKVLGLSTLAYFASLGIYNAVNTNRGYEELGTGLRGGDAFLTQVVDSARPASDLLETLAHSLQLSYKDRYLQDREPRVAQGIEYSTGAIQTAAVVAFLIGLIKKEK